jgi:anti-sigma regulatory factor (Ser/Thr protein kinase)
MQQPPNQTIAVSHRADVAVASQRVKALAMQAGFPALTSDEIALVVKELASNLIRHAQGGSLRFSVVTTEGRTGLEIESVDEGPGFADKERALTDGFSTKGSLGYGLGTVNRLMDEVEIKSKPGPGSGTLILCRRWQASRDSRIKSCPLEFGIATRPCFARTPNGDAFVSIFWGDNGLTGIIDGLGHGPAAHQAAETARSYIDSHFEQPLDIIFQGVGRACSGGRGVVMALARFDWACLQLTFASVGNIEARVWNTVEPISFVVRRGILGVHAPKPVVTKHRWGPESVMVLHSDGLSSRWRWEDCPEILKSTPAAAAAAMLRRFGKNTDDVTVVVVRAKGGGDNA